MKYPFEHGLAEPALANDKPGGVQARPFEVAEKFNAGIFSANM